MRRCLRAVIVVALLCGAADARAQFAVLDTANLAQNILTAARTLEEINNQVMQIQQFKQMLENDARNLASLNFLGLGQLSNSLNQSNVPMNHTCGVANNYIHMNAK